MEKQAEEHRHSVESKQSEELRLYGEIASEVAVMLTDSMEEWTAFLTTAGRLYKWPYEDQLLIYAQRPDATACADCATWNMLNRYIRRGSDAIVLIDNSGTTPALRYVFDFSDTKSGANGRTPWFWEYRDKQHYRAVSAALDRQFGKSKETDMAARLDELSEHLSQEYWNDHKEEILESVEGSFLEDFDPLNVEMAFCHAASVSIAWTLMSRCSLEPEEYFQRQDFENVFDFNTHTRYILCYLDYQLTQLREKTKLALTYIKRYAKMHLFANISRFLALQKRLAGEMLAIFNPHIVLCR